MKVNSTSYVNWEVQNKKKYFISLRMDKIQNINDSVADKNLVLLRMVIAALQPKKQKLEIIKMSVNQRIAQYIEVHSHNRILQSS